MHYKEEELKDFIYDKPIETGEMLVDGSVAIQLLNDKIAVAKRELKDANQDNWESKKADLDLLEGLRDAWLKYEGLARCVEKMNILS